MVPWDLVLGAVPMTQPESVRIVEEQLVPASPGDVWRLITESRNVRRWYAFGGADIDLRPGGAMTLRWDEHGEFSALVERVVAEQLFSFHWLPAPGPLVEISLTPEGASTRVRIAETGVLEDPRQSALAWRNALGLLQGLAKPGRTTAE
jgi:uncharacterized protein YndB with AHSA1/START domain